MTKQVRGETSKAVKAARTKYYGQDKEGWGATLQGAIYRPHQCKMNCVKNRSVKNRSKASHMHMLVPQVHAHDQSSDCASVLCTDLSYRILGDQQYGAQAFISLLQDVFSPAKQASGAMELSAAEVAYAELGVSCCLHNILF